MSGPRAEAVASSAAPIVGGKRAIGERPGAWAGPPLRSTLWFLFWPALLALAIRTLDWAVPPAALYAVAGLYAVALALRSVRDPEWLLAVLILYLPLSRLFVAPIAPGINGTNLLLLLGIVAMLAARDRPPGVGAPLRRALGWWIALSALSFVTTVVNFGWQALFDVSEAAKAWLDGLLVLFLALRLTRDGAMARRLVVYMMIGSCLVMALAFDEWLDKRHFNSIVKARINGPQLQPNDLGAFLVYGSAPFVGLLICGWHRLRLWPLLVYFALLARLLLATFSRGAYLGLAAAIAAAGAIRGKLFLAFVAGTVCAAVVVAPEIVPASLSARLSHGSVVSDEAMDKSSRTRLVLWNAAVDMTLESPLLGKGFGMFPRLKSIYTAEPVEERDNHNMFLYIASQMGIPALIAFVAVIWRMHALGVSVYRGAGDLMGRSVGLGGVALAAGVVGINMFGSRMTDVNVMAHVWVYLAVLCHLHAERGAAVPSGAGR